ncbi:MAG: hypothetical protein HZA24_07950 [Nitrospirae bacterium]|nr:hypothetical protein [Nitrospirota bacterium]
MTTLQAALARLRWCRLSLTLSCTSTHARRRVPGKPLEPPLAVFEAIVKHVNARCPSGPVVFRVTDRDCRTLRLRAGNRFPIEILFLQADQERAWQWLAALDGYLTEAERNFLREGEAHVAACSPSNGDPAAGEELCLEFLTPLPFMHSGRNTHLTAATLLQILEGRIARLSGTTLSLAQEAPDLRVLSHFWEYVEFPRTSSGSGTSHHLKGCLGRLYLRGAEPLMPLLRLCEQAHLGSGELAFGMGYYRILDPAPGFTVERVFDPRRLAGAAERVTRRLADPALPTPALLATEAARDLRRPPGTGGYGTLSGRVVQQALFEAVGPVIGRALAAGPTGYLINAAPDKLTESLEKARAAGFAHLHRWDVADFYPAIDPLPLEDRLRALLPLADGPVVDRMMAVLRGAPGPGLDPPSPLAPALANLHLDDVGQYLVARGMRLVRSAADFMVLGRTPADLRAARALVGGMTGAAATASA